MSSSFSLFFFFSFLKVNSDAEDDPNSAIAGMPVLKVLTLHSSLHSIVLYVTNTIQMLSVIIILTVVIIIIIIIVVTIWYDAFAVMRNVVNSV